MRTLLREPDFSVLERTIPPGSLKVILSDVCMSRFEGYGCKAPGGNIAGKNVSRKSSESEARHFRAGSECASTLALVIPASHQFVGQPIRPGNLCQKGKVAAHGFL